MMIKIINNMCTIRDKSPNTGAPSFKGEEASKAHPLVKKKVKVSLVTSNNFKVVCKPKVSMLVPHIPKPGPKHLKIMSMGDTRGEHMKGS